MRWGARGGTGKKRHRHGWWKKKGRGKQKQDGRDERKTICATRSTGVGQIRCCFRKSQLKQQEMQLQRGIGDLPGFRSEMKEGKKRERETSGKRHVLLETTRLRPLLCAPRWRWGPLLSHSSSVVLPPPTLSPPACPGGRKPPPCPAPRGQFNS